MIMQCNPMSHYSVILECEEDEIVSFLLGTLSVSCCSIFTGLCSDLNVGLLFLCEGLPHMNTVGKKSQ